MWIFCNAGNQLHSVRHSLFGWRCSRASGFQLPSVCSDKVIFQWGQYLCFFKPKRVADIPQLMLLFDWLLRLFKTTDVCLYRPFMQTNIAFSSTYINMATKSRYPKNGSRTQSISGNLSRSQTLLTIRAAISDIWVGLQTYLSFCIVNCILRTLLFRLFRKQESSTQCFSILGDCTIYHFVL